MSDRGPYIQTFSGGRAYLLDPRPEDVRLIDIAHGLSHICRFGGHTAVHYSVAQHSVLVSTLCSADNALIGLLHDATEAYVGDMVSPLKSVMPEYSVIEKRWYAAIDEAFALRGRLIEMPPDVKKADMLALAVEAHRLLTGGPHKWDPELITPNLRAQTVEIDLGVMTPSAAKQDFLNRFASLWHGGAR